MALRLDPDWGQIGDQGIQLSRVWRPCSLALSEDTVAFVSRKNSHKDFCLEVTESIKPQTFHFTRENMDFV